VSILERLREPAPERRRAAFGRIAEAYWQPVYAYLRRHWRLGPEDARDLTQGFLAAAFEKQWFERYQPEQARFRTFVRTCLDRHVMNWRQSEGRLKRGGHLQLVSMDFETAEGGVRTLPAAETDPADRVFHDEFVRAVFARAVDDTRERCRTSGHAAHFRLFERYDLSDQDGLSYADLAGEAGLTVSQVTNHLALVRRRFRDAVLEALRELSGSQAEYREDARAMLGVEVE
jgi:RNA polymerase sigma factor (sigma-70 family)